MAEAARPEWGLVPKAERGCKDRDGVEARAVAAVKDEAVAKDGVGGKGEAEAKAVAAEKVAAVAKGLVAAKVEVAVRLSRASPRSSTRRSGRPLSDRADPATRRPGRQ
jgi:hypothetical protein